MATRTSLDGRSVTGIEGWVILHPDGHVETDYFRVRRFLGKGGVRMSRAAWLRAYRPGCELRWSTLTWSNG